MEVVELLHTVEVTRSRTPLSGNARQTITLAKPPNFPCEKDLLAYVHDLAEMIRELLKRRTAFTPDNKASQDPDILLRSVSYDTG
jgi:hypothetical protein